MCSCGAHVASHFNRRSDPTELCTEVERRLLTQSAVELSVQIWMLFGDPALRLQIARHRLRPTGYRD